MNPLHQKILELLKLYLAENPEQRFGQALFNLRVNQFKDEDVELHQLRDIYNDADENILDRIASQLSWFDLQQKIDTIKNQNFAGMTVNERLIWANLIEDFDRYKKDNKQFAAFILESLSVDKESISKILG